MLDGAVRWLASTGRSGQWGTEPFSAEPRRVAQVRAWAAGGGLRVAETGGVAAGFTATTRFTVGTWRARS